MDPQSEPTNKGDSSAREDYTEDYTDPLLIPEICQALEMFPDSDPDQLYAIFKSQGRNLGRLVEVLESQRDDDGKLRDQELAMLGQVYMDEFQKQKNQQQSNNQMPKQEVQAPPKSSLIDDEDDDLLCDLVGVGLDDYDFPQSQPQPKPKKTQNQTQTQLSAEEADRKLAEDLQAEELQGIQEQMHALMLAHNEDDFGTQQQQQQPNMNQFDFDDSDADQAAAYQLQMMHEDDQNQMKNKKRKAELEQEKKEEQKKKKEEEEKNSISNKFKNFFKF